MTAPLDPEEKTRRRAEREAAALEQRRREADRSWEPNFLLALAELGNVTRAAKAAHVSRSTAYEHRDLFPDVAEAWQAAQDEYTDRLRAELHDRIFTGSEKPIYYRDQLLATVYEKSDTLLMFALKQRDPSFRDSHRVELANADDAPLEITDPARNEADQKLQQWRETMAVQLTALLHGPPDDAPAP